MKNILEVKNLMTRFYTSQGTVHAVNSVSLELGKGETLGIVGESGSGKSVSMMSILRLLPRNATITADDIIFEDSKIAKISNAQIRSIRGNKISMIFQEPMTSLNPVLTIGKQLTEGLKLHKGMGAAESRKRAVELLQMVGIPNPAKKLDRYTFEFSGGMLQRAMIAMAISCDPQVLIADEPTTALDVTVQAQVIELVKEMRNRLSMSIIWITHDLAVIAGLVDRVIVMYSGYVMENAPVRELFKNPKHPYTIGLIRSVPSLEAKRHQKLYVIGGRPPNLMELPQGCPFYPRCSSRMDHCEKNIPPLVFVQKNHQAACWLLDKTGGNRE